MDKHDAIATRVRGLLKLAYHHITRNPDWDKKAIAWVHSNDGRAFLKIAYACNYTSGVLGKLTVGGIPELDTLESAVAADSESGPSQLIERVEGILARRNEILAKVTPSWISEQDYLSQAPQQLSEFLEVAVEEGYVERLNGRIRLTEDGLQLYAFALEVKNKPSKQ